MFTRRPSRRPYAKWERLSAAALVVVALFAVVIRHVDPSRAARTSSGSSGTTSLVGRAPSAAPTSTSNAVEQAPIELSPQADPRFVQIASASTDFAGDAVDPSQWSVYDGPGNENVGLRRPSAVTVDNHELTITGKGDVSGGLAQTNSQVYGRWVIRAKMDKGLGYGPAILLWPDSEQWPQDGEIDIVELPSGDRSQAVMSAHYSPNNLQLSQTMFGDYSQWHTYAVDWLPDRIAFYIDGVQRYQITDPDAIPTKSMHLAIQNDVGACSSWIGCRDSSTPASVALHVSAVQVYRYSG